MTIWPLALLAVLPGTAIAQEGAVLPLGARVRVSTPERRIAGTLARLRDDTVAVVPDGGALPVALPYATLVALEVSRGRFRRTGRGALIGLGIGVAGGVATALAVCHGDRCESSGDDWTGIAVAGLGLGSALAGLGLGALVGSFIHQEKWREVSLTWMRTGAAPGRRPGLALSIPFRVP